MPEKRALETKSFQKLKCDHKTVKIQLKKWKINEENPQKGIKRNNFNRKENNRNSSVDTIVL